MCTYTCMYIAREHSARHEGEVCLRKTGKSQCAIRMLKCIYDA